MIGDVNFEEKRGQVTIFIIVGIFIVFSILIIFFLQNSANKPNNRNINPYDFIENCVKKTIEPVAEDIILNGGLYYDGLNDGNFFVENTSRMAILCYANISKASCLNPHPMIFEEAKSVIKSKSVNKINSCFNELKKSYIDANVSGGAMEIEVELEDGLIVVNIKRPFMVSYEESSYSFNNFNIHINSRLYNFLELSNLIVNAESSCDCNAKVSSYNNSGKTIYMSANGVQNPYLVNNSKSNCDIDLMKFNKEYKNFVFSKKNLLNGERIYTISSLSSPLQNFSFFIKNCFSGCDGPGDICYHHRHEGNLIIYDRSLTSCHNSIHHYHDETWEYIVI